MKRLLSCFWDVESAVEDLVYDKEEHRYFEAIGLWIFLAIVTGLVTLVIYQRQGYSLQGLVVDSRLKAYCTSLVNQEGLKWLIIAGIDAVGRVVRPAVTTMVWITLLYIANKVLKDDIAIQDIILIVIYGMATNIFAQLISAITIICISHNILDSIYLASEILIGIGIIFQYWYLVMFVIGYSICTNCTFRKSLCIVMTLQIFIWLVERSIPYINTFLL